MVFFGAYFLWLLYSGFHIPRLLSLPLALATTALLGLVIEPLTIHPLIGQPLFSVFLITIAVFMALDGIAPLILKGDIRVYQPALLPTQPIMLGSIAISPVSLGGFGAALVVALALAAFFRRTALGLRMRITAEDHLIAQSMGIGVQRVFSLIWVISAMVTGLWRPQPGAAASDGSGEVHHQVGREESRSRGDSPPPFPPRAGGDR